MIGILGGMGTQAGLDFCNKLAILNRGKIDQDYPLFLLYNKSNIPGRPESIGIQTRKLSNRSSNKNMQKKYASVLKSLLIGCKLLKKSKCKFIVIPCNTAHYWYDDLKNRIKLPIINMPKEVFNHTKKRCKKNTSIGLLATEGTIMTGVYNQFFDKTLVHNLLGNKKAKIISSISMFYDLESPITFAQDVYECLGNDGIWHLEQSYMPSMIKNVSYDTICHEHLEYYSLETIKYIFDYVGFKIIDLEFNDINGGSFSITVAKKKSKFQEYSKIVNWLLEREKILDYNSPLTHLNFYKNVKKHKKLLRDLIDNLKDMKKKVIGYGASTKGNVILQYCNINKNDLKFIADVNLEKKNKYTPGSLIKITDEKAIKKYNPDYMLVLPWHFKNFILQKEKKYLNNGGKMIFPLPDIEIV